MQGSVLAPFRFSRLLARAPRALRWSVTTVGGCELAMLVCASLAIGQTTINWTNSSGGLYQLSTNWTPANVPDESTEDARFALAAAYNVTFIPGSNTTVRDLLVEDGSVTFASNGATSASYSIERDASINAAVLTLSEAGGSGNVTLAINDDLRVRDGGTLNVLMGSDVEVSRSLSVGSDLGLGVVLVSGSGSTLNVIGTGAHFLGQSGQTGTLTFDDHSTGNSIAGTLNLGRGVAGASTGILEVFDGASVNLGSLIIGPGTSDQIMASVTVGANGGDEANILQTGTSTLSIGSTSNNIATLTVESDGTFTTGSGQITVNPSGMIEVHDGGRFRALGNMLLDGGTLRVNRPSSDFSLDSSLMLTAQNDARVEFDNVYYMNDGTTFHITDGAVLNSRRDLYVQNDSTLLVEGNTSQLMVNNMRVGFVGTGVVTISEGATASVGVPFGSLRVGSFLHEDTNGLFEVKSGAMVNADSVFVGAVGSGNGSITVGSSGADSTMRITGGDLTVGSPSTGPATLSINSGGVVNAGRGTVTIDKNGLVHMNGGTFAAEGDIIINEGELRRQAGSFFWADGQTMTISDGGLVDFTGEALVLPANAAVNVNNGTIVNSQLSVDPTATFSFNLGTLHDTNDLILSANDGLADVRRLTFGKTLIVQNETTLSSAVLTIDGGTFSTGSLANAELLDFRRGTFELTGDDLTIGGGGLLGAALALPFGKVIKVTNTINVAADSLVSLQGGQLSGDTINNSGRIDMATANSTLMGGKVNNAGLISGDGEITAVMNNQSGGEVRVSTGEQLHLTAGGNSNDGQISLFGGTAEFTDDLINNAAGVITGQGSLIIGGGLINNGALSFGGTTNIDGNVTNNGSGVITASGGSTTNFFDDLVNNGELAIGTSSFATIFGTLSGSGIVTGDGTLIIEGQFNPGMSPAAVEVATELQLGADAVLRIELGGVIPGTQYDQVNVTGAVELDGGLTVAAIDGFLPQVGDTFEIITYSSLSGTFDQVVFAGGLRGTLDVGPSSMTLAITTVPEPAAVVLLLAGMLGVIGVRCRRAGF